MKKATHIVALPVLTALLAACAAPVEQGRLDQIEKDTTTLADQTLVEGLQDDFEEIREQKKLVEALVKAKEQVAETPQELQELQESQELMAKLEDDFEKVEEQLEKVEEQTDLAAKLDLADELKQKLDVLALDLDKVKVMSVEEEVVLYRELTYTFRNLDAIELTKPNRAKYVADLETAFNDNEAKWDYKLDRTEYQQKRPPNDEKWSSKKTEKGWELSGVRFKLSNLAKGISEDVGQKGIEDFVKKVTDENAVGLVKGTPVVWKADPPKPVTFKTLAVNYSSASGGGNIDTVYERPVECPPARVTYSLKGIVKQEYAKAYIYYRDMVSEAGWTDKSELLFPTVWKKDLGVCEVLPYEQTARIMVLLRDEEQELPPVAEYHTLTASIPENTGKPAPDHTKDHKVEKGRLTKGIPACPPAYWEDARNAFIDKLYEVGVGCTDGYKDPVRPLPAG